MQSIRTLIEKFSKVKVLVVGDVMLDRYWWGTVSRISPEAPVPVVALEKTSVKAGGAANVAANVAGLGAEPFLIGITGEDEAATIFPAALAEAGVRQFNLISLKNRPTTIKTRIIAQHQQVARIDQETIRSITKEDLRIVFAEIEKVFEEVNVVLISDYAKGLLTEELLLRLITMANKAGKMVLVDPKGKDYSKYKGATILTPNLRETAEACNVEDHNELLVEKAAKHLLEDLGLRALLITQGEKGMTLLQEGRKISHLKASARNVFDVTGAGDTVIASMAVAVGAGLGFFEAAKIANASAGLVVEQVGTTAITAEMLEENFQTL